MLGFRIAALRKQSGLNQAELAALVKVSPSAVGMYEQGRREPSAEILLALARVFQVSVDYLLTGDPGEQSRQQVETMLSQRLRSAEQKLQNRQDRPFSREELAVLFAALLMDPM